MTCTPVATEEGKQAPGLDPGIRFGSNLREPLFSRSGIGMITVDLLREAMPRQDAERNGRTFWRELDGNLSLAVQPGQIAPTADPTTKIFQLGSAAINSAGHVAIYDVPDGAERQHRQLERNLCGRWNQPSAHCAPR